jgi:hypothetical protein
VQVVLLELHPRSFSIPPKLLTPSKHHITLANVKEPVGRRVLRQSLLCRFGRALISILATTHLVSYGSGTACTHWYCFVIFKILPRRLRQQEGGDQANGVNQERH